MGTKNNPGKYDCYDNAAPDEPMFVLLARDADAPGLVMRWADQREATEGPSEKVEEARACARAMWAWQDERRQDARWPIARRSHLGRIPEPRHREISTVKPPFAYYGGKMGMADRIVAMLPPHRVYMEPFAGSLAVLFAKPPTVHEIVNDLDGALTTFFRVLRDRPEDLERVCALTPHARAEFDAADLDEELDDLERARRFWVRVNQSFAKTAGRRTGWTITTARTQSVPGTIISRLGRFGPCAERLARVSIERCDAAGLVERLATADTAIYVDPPYLASSRVARQGGSTEDYRHDMGTEDEHRRLAAALHETPAAVLLSGYHSPLYDELYEDWPVAEFAVTAHSSNAARSGRTPRVEVLWSNRALDRGQLWNEATA